MLNINVRCRYGYIDFYSFRLPGFFSSFCNMKIKMPLLMSEKSNKLRMIKWTFIVESHQTMARKRVL
jgi:hypothetical protein